MGRLKTIARRTFLFGSAAIVGGVAFGTYLYKKPVANPLLDDLGENEASMTEYVRITADGVTLITPRADKGQGVYHVQAALIAEEMDIDLDQVTVEPGPPSPAYYNTALSAEAPGFMPTDEGFAANSVRTVMDAAMKIMGVQITGGSSTVADSWEKLRVAGAVARETIKAAAALETGVDVGEMRTARGAVILPDGSELTYIELAATAATLDPVDAVALKDPSEWRYIGKDMQRLDIVPKSTGTQTYGIDMELDGMVHATVITNPRKDAAMLGFDSSEAETMRGVLKVVELPNGVGVIADNTWRAFQAAQAISFDWDAATYPAEQEDHWAALADSFKDDQRDSRYRDDGDVDDALDSADVIDVEYRAPYVAHAPLEPINATALITDTRADIWTGTQTPRFAQSAVAELTGLDDADVHIHVLMMGGSFGHRLEIEVVKQAALLGIAMKDTPVKLTYSREEDMAHDYTRQIAMARMRGSVKDGQVDTLDLGIAMPSVTSSQMGRLGLSVPGPDPMIVAGAWDQPFGIPNYRVTGYRSEPLAPISSWRSVGASTNGFFHDSALDELIHAAGADPMEERIRLAWDDNSRAVLEAVAEMSGWDGPDMGPSRGRGVAFCMSFGVPCAEVVEVTNTDRGIQIDKAYAVANVGRIIDPINLQSQMSGAMLWGLGHAMFAEITHSDGMTDQINYDGFQAMRQYQAPEIQVRGLELGDHVRGIGEPPVPPAAPALANAIFAATGQRIREMPFSRHIDFV
ncbi:isoquinoline 1-oxidoreductase, beta subunit [Octadecabacter temperatus]|uniref:Isoquinoline 1-oxidoreductase subunit beta n=1 Tax=Octadecabacter temperatus TaxID=1458307 RepID=A0A0K0Y4V8_9RHOB|nr:molybdopterin cofactor-binding domain-containing protein [Octadecabacter temperatus]AKS45911.1 Isoquinoline 1-oxidoreductase subunit beta [Octadecabacter temperatus]SIO03329.1 isoquinoline 1-oxidoreductase, beta subunit [Octadecabacter temperatus]